MRRTLRRCIEQDSRWEVCGEAENGQIAVEKVSQLAPDLIILDWQMPVMDGLAAARQIARIAPQTTIVMFTLHPCEEVLQYAKAAGIGHVISKMEGGPNALLALLRSISLARDSPATAPLPGASSPTTRAQRLLKNSSSCPALKGLGFYRLLKNSGSCPALKGLGFSRAVTSLFFSGGFSRCGSSSGNAGLFRSLLEVKT
jgi:CheY-like chemotaxis protein